MNALEEYRRRNSERDLRRKASLTRPRSFGSETFLHPDRVTRFAWWVAAFTGGLVLVGILQAYAFIQSERSFLSISAMRVVSNANQSPMLVHVEVRNSGRTSATGIMYEFLRGELPEIPEYKDGIAIEIGPVTPGNTYLTTLTMGLTAEQIANIRSGTIPFSFYGFIEYKDDFSLFGGRRIAYCYTYNAKGDPAVSTFDTCKNVKYLHFR